MKKLKSGTETGIYADKETEIAVSFPVPFLAPGMETRISAAADVIGTRIKAAAVMGISADSLQRYLRGQNAPAFETIARLCAAAGVRMEWMAFDQAPMFTKDLQTAPQSDSHPVRHEVLTVALQLADEALEGKTLPVDKRAELVGIIYDLLEEGLPNAKVLRFARTAIH